MKTLIINSPLFRDRNLLYDEDSLPPIGLGYIATYLKGNGIEVKLIDAVDQKIPLIKLLNIIAEEKPEFVATNIFTTNYELVKELIESIEATVKFIIGGLSTKELYKKIIDWKTPNNITVVTGDGEFITLDIIRDTLMEEPFIKLHNRQVFKVDTNSVYLVKDISGVELDRTFFLNEPVLHPLGFIEGNIVTSRGCIYNCTFCAAARSLNGDYPIRERTVESIIQELENIKVMHPDVNSIRVLDDLFLKHKASVEKAISVFSNFNLQWRSMAHVMTFHQVEDAMMNKLKQSGCHELFIGIESGSPRILSSIKKTSNTDTIISNLGKVMKSGIHIKGYFIYGFPGETSEDMELTYKLASRLKLLSIEHGVNFRTSVFQYRPYHATQIYHDLQKDEEIIDIKAIQPNAELSHLVGRLQFNFHNGNYSLVDINEVHDYIYRTINLNGGEIFAGLKPLHQSMPK
jgi:anaerobic magnesium-protoporphyrin IX monomethyl ester cyclase